MREYYDTLKRRTVLLLRSITEEQQNTVEINRLTDLMITYTKPSVFSGTENAEIQYDKQFETMCLILSERFNVQPKGFTVLEFYNAFEQYVQARKEQEKAIKRKR